MESENKPTLSPCPFCGGSVELWNTGFGIVKIIECKTCHIKFVFQWNKTGADLYEAWKRRAPG